MERRIVSPDESDYGTVVASEPQNSSTEKRLSNRTSRYGWGSYRPDFLQWLNRPEILMTVLFCCTSTLGMSQFGLINATLTTIEKRFHLTSFDTGLIVGASELAFVLFCVPVAYKASRPGSSYASWMGWAMILVGLGSLVYIFPHSFSSPYISDGTVSNHTQNVLTCSLNQTDSCSKSEKGYHFTDYRVFFLVGQLLHGIGAIPMHVLGLNYIDENIPKQKAPLYVGIYGAGFVVGTVLGFIGGSYTLNVFIDWPGVDPATLGLNKDNDIWLGAWWLGFLLTVIFSFVFAIIVSGFPPKIKNGRPAEEEEEQTDIYEHTNIFSEVWKVLTDVPYMLLAFAESTQAFVGFAVMAFLPKLVENQFNIPASDAAFIGGSLAVPPGITGGLLSGYLLTRFKVSTENTFKICAIGAVVMLVSSLSFFPTCDNPNYVGINTPYYNQTEHALKAHSNLTSKCNKDCHCDDVGYNPICGPDDMIYYSPCRAGCKTKETVEGIEVYKDCSCIPSTLNHSSHLRHSFSDPSIPFTIQATQDKCSSTCKLFPMVVVLMVILVFMSMMHNTPSTAASLRCIPAEQKTLAFSIRTVLVRLLGGAAGPIVLGVALDGTCIFWDQTSCDTGACAVYDLHRMNRTIMYLVLLIKSIGVVLYTAAWWTYKNNALKTELKSV